MSVSKIRVMALRGSCLAALWIGTIQAQEVNKAGVQTAASQSAKQGVGVEEIVVTARKRSERLMTVPVAVSAMSASTLARYKADDLTKIGELTPTVIVGSYKQAGGGSISIRGIGSPATQTGFDQAVSVAIDGVQFSNGRIATLGFFDLQQVEVLKGPQALFFGKNSSAGVISVTTAGPTDTLEVGGKATYEFAGDEATVESYVSGPISSTLKGRLALRYRDMKGWMYNDAQPVANPFYKAGQPSGAAQLPGSVHSRLGDKDVLGRMTLQFDPSSNFSANLKLFAGHEVDDGNGSAVQNIGPCPSGQPKVYAVADPNGECRRDNHTSYGDVPATIAQTMLNGQPSGQAYGETAVFLSSLTMNLELDQATLTSVTGFSRVHNYSFSGLDSSTFSQLAFVEETTDKAFSQEFRVLTHFDSPFNFMAGSYYQSTDLDFFNDGKFRDDLGYNAANGRWTSYDRISELKGHALSFFGQVTWNIQPNLELVGGARWTSEQKDFRTHNIYGFNSGIGQFDTLNTIYASSIDQTPGVLAGRFSDHNVSPEVTLTYHPDKNATLYAAYKTGYKSGGFGVQTPLNRFTTLSDVDYGSETALGFELGAKGEFFDRRLRLTSALFAYDFKNLQVATYNPNTITFQLNNAGKVKQKGAEIEATFRANDILTLHSALSYVHNRFQNYTGQCYGYTIPVAQALTAAAPQGCSFLLNVNGSRALNGSGGAILQQVYDGRAPSRSPDWAGNIGAALDIPLNEKVNLGITGDAFYSASYVAGDTQAPSTVQDAFWRFNASVRLADANGRWEFALLGRNLTNQYYLLYAGDRTGGTSVPLTVGEQRGIVARGREIALQASFRFN